MRGHLVFSGASTLVVVVAGLVMVGCGSGSGSEGGGGTGPPPETFTLSVTPTSIQLPQSVTQTVQVVALAQHGFSGSVTITAAGLPSGVTGGWPAFAPPQTR